MYDLLPDQLVDCRLAQQAQAGNTSAAETLLRKYYPLIRSQAKDYSAPGAELDDLVLEAKLGAWFAIMMFDESKSIPISVLIKQVARNRVFTFIKQANREYNKILNEAVRFDPDGPITASDTIDPECCEITPEQTQNPADIAIYRLEQAELVGLMHQSLSKMEFDVVSARARGLKYEEIAERFNSTKKNVDNALCRARKKFSMLYE